MIAFVALAALFTATLGIASALRICLELTKDEPPPEDPVDPLPENGHRRVS